MPYANPEKLRTYMNEYNRAWRKKKRALHSEDERLKARAKYQRQRSRILMLLGGKCERCDCNVSQLLQVDHINSDGWKERDFSYKYSKGMQHVFKNIANYQLLCVTHNWIKRYEKGEGACKTKKQPIVDSLNNL